MQGLIEIRQYVNDKLNYRKNEFGNGYEAEQNVEEVLEELLAMIDRIGGRIIAEQVLTGTQPHFFARAAKRHAQCLKARMEFKPCAAPQKETVMNKNLSKS
jgi:hypothetical protein